VIRPLAPPPVTDFPSPPVAVFPWPVVDTPWIKARLIADDVSGWMLDETVKGDRRTYLFEASFDGDRLRATVSACDPSNPNPFENRNGGWQRQIIGLPERARPDLVRRARAAATYLRDLKGTQQQWLLDQFEADAVPATVIRRDGKPLPPGRSYAVCRGWLISRGYDAGGRWASARRLDADNNAGGLIVRRAAP
jgi:hypothetical protein